MLKDSYQRNIEYLRLSVTDLCNIRCWYCMPEQGIVKKAREEILSFEEIIRLVSIFAALGIHTVRITGGEPLVRKNLPFLIKQLKEITGIREVCLTTNAMLLAGYAAALSQAGLDRINIHLDTLEEQKFFKITRGARLDTALAGLTAVIRTGFKAVKLNAVLQKGVNDDEIETLTRFAAECGAVIRFIELMPIGPGKDREQQFMPTQIVIDRLTEHWTLLPYGKRLGSGPAEYFKVVELGSVIGLIHPVSRPFCAQCNRVRVSADGHLQDCLAYEGNVSLRTLLRNPQATDEDIVTAIQVAIGMKREDHSGFLLPQYKKTCGMYGIGG